MSDRLEAAVRELVAALREDLAGTGAPEPSAPRLLSIQDAAEALGGIARSSVYRAIQAGRIQSVTVGSRRLIPESEIARLAGQPTGGRP